MEHEDDAVILGGGEERWDVGSSQYIYTTILALLSSCIVFTNCRFNQPLWAKLTSAGPVKNFPKN